MGTRLSHRHLPGNHRHSPRSRIAYTHSLNLEVPDVEVSMDNSVLESDCNVGVLLGALVRPVLRALHLDSGKRKRFNLEDFSTASKRPNMAYVTSEKI